MTLELVENDQRRTNPDIDTKYKANGLAYIQYINCIQNSLNDYRCFNFQELGFLATCGDAVI